MIKRPTPALRDFLKSEAGGGRLAMLFANLPGPAGAPPSCLRSCGLKGGLGKQIGIFGSILAGLRLSAVTGYLVLRRAKYR